MVKIFCSYAILLMAFLFGGCLTKKSSPQTIKKDMVMPEQHETIQIKSGSSMDVPIKSRGALGLQLGFSTTPDDLVSVTRIENDTAAKTQPGDAINAVFRIQAIKPGLCKVSFFETQPWNKDFKPIIQKEFNLDIKPAQ